MSKKGQFALGIAVVGLFVASFAAVAPKTVKATIATLVRDEDNAARHPFTALCFLPPTITAGASCSMDPIPPGEEVVIETVNLVGDASPSEFVMRPIVNTTTAGTSESYFFSAVFDDGISQPNHSFFIANESVRLYADPNTSIRCTLENASFTSKDISCSVSGYFVTLP